MRSDRTSKGSMGVYGARPNRCGRRKASPLVGAASVAAEAPFWDRSDPAVASILQLLCALLEMRPNVEAKQGAAGAGAARVGQGQWRSIAAQNLHLGCEKCLLKAFTSTTSGRCRRPGS